MGVMLGLTKGRTITSFSPCPFRMKQVGVITPPKLHYHFKLGFKGGGRGRRWKPRHQSTDVPTVWEGDSMVYGQGKHSCECACGTRQLLGPKNRKNMGIKQCPFFSRRPPTPDCRQGLWGSARSAGCWRPPHPSWKGTPERCYPPGRQGGSLRGS